VSITSPTPSTVSDPVYLTTTDFPYTMNIAGLITTGNGHAKLSVKVNTVDATLAQDSFTNVTNAVWTGTYSVASPGSYTVLAMAERGSTADTDTVSVVYALQTVIVDYPAAPAVANDLLDGSLKGKQHGKCISAVADHMGSSTVDQSGTDFSGVAKSSVEAYRTAVQTFLGTTSACGGTPPA